MASRFQRGCLRQEHRKDGTVWKLRYFTRSENGERVERTLFVGYKKDLPTESDAWREVERQRLTEKINNPALRGSNPTFRYLSEHFIVNDLTNPNVINPRAETTIACYKHVIRAYLIEHWGDRDEIKPAEVEHWLKKLSVDKNPDGLEWPTLSKIRNVMGLIYAHAQREGLIQPN